MLTDAQLTERRTGIGGSDIAAVMGKSPWASATDIYLLKLDLVEVPETEPMYWGSAAEPMILDRYLRDHGVFADDPTGTLRDIEDVHRPLWCIATPDAIICNAIDWLYGVEIKTAHAFAADQWADGVPEHYAMQCQWYMMVTGLSRWDVAVLIGGNDYREFTLERDDEMIAEMFAAADHFWHEHVEKEVPPEPTTPAECAQQFTSDDGVMIAANADAEDIVLEYYGHKSCERMNAILAESAKARIQALIGTNAGIEGPWGRITWKANAKGSRTFRCTWNEEYIDEVTQ